MTKESKKVVAVTLPAPIKAYLLQKAQEGYRSLNKEIARRIEESCVREMKGNVQ